MEIFECLDCAHAGELNRHGRCNSCDSDNVLSREVIMARYRMTVATLNKVRISRVIAIPPHLIGQA